MYPAKTEKNEVNAVIHTNQLIKTLNPINDAYNHLPIFSSSEAVASQGASSIEEQPERVNSSYEASEEVEEKLELESLEVDGSYAK